jgi:ribonuclease BN (tRNA processing enzyme)
MTRLVVLGSCGAWVEPGRASSAFLLDHDGFRIVLDLGYGVLSRLLAELGSARADGLDAAIVTHRHADHVADLHGLFRALRLGERDGLPLPLYAGEGVLDVAEAMEMGDPGLVRQVFDVHPLPAPPYAVGPFVLESVALPHHVPNAGVRLTAAGGLAIAYTGDTGPAPEIAQLGRDADLFIVDALCLTARQAGEAAQAANAKRLLLTHFWPGTDREASRDAAAGVFGGEVLIAGEGLIITVAPT